MFDIGFPELILVAIVGLLVIGPDKLPETLRTLGLWLGRMRRSFTNVKAEIEKEIGMDEVRRQLHNEAIMEEMKRIEQEVKSTADSARQTLNEGARAAQASAPEQPTPAEADASAQIPNIDPQVQMDIADAISAQDQIAPEEARAADDRDHSDAADPEPTASDRDEPQSSDAAGEVPEKNSPEESKNGQANRG
ncbi:MAG: Sec-independent protein translocase protein TatB [Gammaproteobacteria bacterium]|jgi:sec-independent protein translocase protein TatB